MYIEIRDQNHEMSFEGTDSKKPEKKKIKIAIIGEGFIPYRCNVWYDSMQKIWRFSGKIRR